MDSYSVYVCMTYFPRSKLTNGQVQHGVWRKDLDSSKFDVTLKTLDLTAGGSGEETLNESEVSAVARLLQEAVIMRQFRHPNILRLHGVVYEERVSECNVGSIASEYSLLIYYFFITAFCSCE